MRSASSRSAGTGSTPGASTRGSCPTRPAPPAAGSWWSPPRHRGAVRTPPMAFAPPTPRRPSAAASARSRLETLPSLWREAGVCCYAS
ncbi:RING-H2 finger protein [Musa troglodytarum]|uniref:RING-H2 finger protein n=1 Tax=Musa troglodytarum TaxID=320322 RepID=A0A9E7EI54_9LILI|nr:RING-H2 finger protein [Musa troglodytarum]